MSDLELTEEERALLELDESAEDDSAEGEQSDKPETPKKRASRKPKAEKPSAAEEPVSRQPGELDAEPEPEREPLSGPGAGHPHAQPAQHGWDDPWGQLPTQMRHDMEGRPAF